ncbi:hypothetical protein M0R45_006805 [Rubus argutus]|uniref:Uncharacterized protein n=1 Tax=Rubus argutus TaxID=59490 RepID=A0AAW1YS07_RUBAR
MGLEEMPDDHSRQKRQQLLGALEKCDQDLKALKKMIDVVRVRGPSKRSGIINNRFSDANFKLIKKHSPVSVLDASPSGNHPYNYYYYSDKQLSFNVNYGGRGQQRKKPVAAEEDYYYLSNPNPTSFINKSSPPPESSWHSKRMKNMMTDSVGQVCRDIAWGEQREIGRIGLALQDHIYKTLIQELVAEMKSSYSYTSTSNSSRVCSLSFEVCREG